MSLPKERYCLTGSSSSSFAARHPAPDPILLRYVSVRRPACFLMAQEIQLARLEHNCPGVLQVLLRMPQTVLHLIDKSSPLAAWVGEAEMFTSDSDSEIVFQAFPQSQSTARYKTLHSFTDCNLSLPSLRPCPETYLISGASGHSHIPLSGLLPFLG